MDTSTLRALRFDVFIEMLELNELRISLFLYRFFCISFDELWRKKFHNELVALFNLLLIQMRYVL